MPRGNKDFVSISRVALEHVQWHPTYKNIIIEGIDEAGDKRVHLELIKLTGSLESNPVEWSQEFYPAIRRFIHNNCASWDDDLYDKIITAVFPVKTIGE